MIVFVLHARHIGLLLHARLASCPRAAVVARQVIDVLTYEGDLIKDIRVVGDELAGLVQIGGLSTLVAG